MNVVYIICLAVIIWLLYKLYLFWTVSNLNADLDHKIFNKKILDVNSTYEQGTLWPPYPNLWYPVIQSRNLRPGQVKPLYVFEKNLVVFRTVSGRAHILDAFCPHLGAHLGVGGSVVGVDIRCAFHSWTFNGDGVCTKVPGFQSEETPKARVKSWKCFEINDWIYVWYHHKDLEPSWKPRLFKEIRECCHTGQIETFINGHLVELLGNTSDLDHFDSIHSMAGIISPEEVLKKGQLYNFMRKIFYFDYQVQWNCGNNKTQYLAYNQAVITPVLFGSPLNSWSMMLHATLSPPVFHITTTLTKFNINFHLLTTMTPISPLRIHCIHNIYHGPGFKTRLFARIAFNSMVSSLEPDQLIFNHKKFLISPYFSHLDKSQMKYLQWFRNNFYSF